MKKTFTKSIRIGHILVLVLIAGMSISVLGQTSHVVDVTNNIFTPDEITIMKGDTVIWTNLEGNHNVNGSQTKFPENPESFKNDVGPGWVFSYVFTDTGTYDYQCDPHAQFGMTGKVMVEALPDITSVEDLDVTPTFEIYPNPAFSELTITSDFAIKSVSVINVMGAILMTQAGLSATEHMMTLEGISPGVYFLEVRTTGNKTQISRFIKR
jgi:plastocyanin